MESFGFFLAIIASLSHVIKGILQKTSLKGVSSNILVFFLSFFSIVFWLPFVLYYGIPEISTKLIFVFIVGGFLFYIGKIFHFKALQIEDISYITPLQGLVTIGVVLTGILILNEYPNLFGILGILIILLGVYFLNIQKYHTKVLEPIKHIFTNKGSQYFLITISCYSFTNIFDKIGVLESYPIFWLFIMNIFLFFSSLIGFSKDIKGNINMISKNICLLVFVLIFYIIGHIAQFSAIQYILIGYMSAIKTSSIIFTILIGGIFFKEKELFRKMIIGCFIVLGIILIYFG